MRCGMRDEVPAQTAGPWAGERPQKDPASQPRHDTGGPSRISTTMTSETSGRPGCHLKGHIMARSPFVSASSSRPPCAKRMIGRIGVGLTGLFVVALAAGCTPAETDKTLMTIAPDWDSFDREVLKSPRPVLVEFSKDPCPPCVDQKAELETLTDPFRGQVTFATMTLVQGEFVVTCPRIQEGYKILWLPTTILFVDGKERKRWQNLHKAAGIREELKQALLEKSSSP